MERLKRTRRMLNRLSEPLRAEEPEPSEEEARAFEEANPDVLACIDPDDPANN